MKAIGYARPLPVDDAESLVEFELPAPTLRPNDVLVRVKAVSVNPVDVKLRAAATPPAGQPRILGFDAAGVVEAVGPEAKRYRVGDEVFYAGSIDRPGTNAELHAVDERIVGPKPKRLSFAEAASLPLTSITAWELLFDRLKVPRDSKASLLVVGGAGGVGSMVIQLARKLTNLTIIATASRPETRAWCLELGAHHVVDHSKPLNVEVAQLGIGAPRFVTSLTNTASHWLSLVDVTAPQGQIAVIDDPKTLDAVPMKRKSLSLHWELMFTRPLFTTDDLIEQQRLLSEVSRLVDDGTLRSTATESLGRLTPTTLKAAHKLIETGRAKGKVVLDGL